MSVWPLLVMQIIILLTLSKYTNASGTVLFKFVKFYNKGHETSQIDDVCDGGSGNAIGYCDYAFYITVCADGCTSDYSKGHFQDYSSETIEFGSYFGMSNPVTHHFTRYPGSVSMTLKIMDQDSGSTEELVIKNYKTWDTPPDGMWHGYYFSNIYGQRFDYAIKVECDSNYYGSKCTKYCSSNRYYICDSDGDKRCRSNWRDVSRGCRLWDYCASSPCKNGGSCNNVGNHSYSCNCDDNYYGRQCTKYCAPDKYSSCDSSGNKQCRSGWRDISRGCRLRDFCLSSPCKNGGQCVNNDDNTFTCSCPAAFFGQTCEVRGIEIYDCDEDYMEL